MQDERLNLPSASGFHRIVHCPASRDAESQSPIIEVGSEVREFGDVIHDALLTGEIQDLAANAEQVYQKISAIEEAAIDEFKSNLGDCAVVKDVKEVRYWVCDNNGNKLCSAKVDRAVIVRAKGSLHCILIDAKSGFTQVTKANANWQLRLGLVALDQELGPFETALVCIAQYRIKQSFSASHYNRGDIDHAYKEIVFYDRRSKNPDAPFAAGEWCTYCRAKANCATHAAYNMLPSVKAQSLNLSKKEIVASVSLLSHQDLAFVVSRATSIANFVEAVKDRLKTLSDEELLAVGLRRVSTGSMPAAFNIPEIWKVLSEKKLCDEATFQSWCKMVLGDMKEHIVPRLALRHDCTKAEAEKMFVELVKPHITYEEKSKAIKSV